MITSHLLLPFQPLLPPPFLQRLLNRNPRLTRKRERIPQTDLETVQIDSGHYAERVAVLYYFQEVVLAGNYEGLGVYEAVAPIFYSFYYVRSGHSKVDQSREKLSRVVRMKARGLLSFVEGRLEEGFSGAYPTKQAALFVRVELLGYDAHAEGELLLAYEDGAGGVAVDVHVLVVVGLVWAPLWAPAVKLGSGGGESLGAAGGGGWGVRDRGD